MWIPPTSHAAKALEEGVKIIMRTAVYKEAKRVVMRGNDVAIVVTEFAGMVVIEATDEVDEVMESRDVRSSLKKRFI